MDKDWAARFRTKPPSWRWFILIVFWLTPIWIGPWYVQVLSTAIFVLVAWGLFRKRSY